MSSVEATQPETSAVAETIAPKEPVVIDYSDVKKAENYNVIVLHTPWTQMTDDELASIPVADITSDDATLYLWTDSSNMAKSVKLIDSYGFQFKSIAAIVDISEHVVDKPETTEPIAATEDEMTVGEDEEVVNKKPKTPKRARIKSINPFGWWSSPSNDISRVTSELLLIAHKGEGAVVSPKYKLQQFQVINIPELAKNKSKARSSHGDPEWNFKRSDAVFDMVTAAYPKTTRVIDLFSGVVHANAASFSPNNPVQFVPQLSGDEGLIGEAKQVTDPIRKVALKSISAKFRKALTLTDDEKVDDSVKSMLSEMSDKWQAMHMKRLMSIIVDHTLESRPVRVKKEKKSKAELPADRKKYGIESQSHISKELCDVLDLPHGSMIARTEMNQKLNQYIKTNNLKDGKIIKMDDKMKKLLKPDDNEPITFFTLGYRISPHFESKITEDLQKFLNLDNDKVPLVEAEQFMDAYAKKNGLYDADGVTIIPDDALKKLFDTQDPIKDISAALVSKFIKKQKKSKRKAVDALERPAVKRQK